MPWNSAARHEEENDDDDVVLKISPNYVALWISDLNWQAQKKDITVE